MKKLVLDIETAPNLAHVWGLWKQNVSLNQLMQSSYVLCWAAKWHGEDKIYFDSVYRNSPEKMITNAHKLLTVADAVIHYNGTSFDIPTLNQEILTAGLLPPAPFKNIDLLVTVKNNFRFPSNKLDYVAQRLGIGKKTEHQGHELWVGCMNNDKDCWQKMQQYNENDVVLTEQVYDRLLPWIKNHPNSAIIDELEHCCPKCGSKNLQSRGYAFTNALKYRRFQCKDCGTWSRNVKREGESLPIKHRLTLE